MEELREKVWNLCKQFDATGKRRIKTLLSNFVSTELERESGAEFENSWREEWQEEVALFAEKYGYS